MKSEKQCGRTSTLWFTFAPRQIKCYLIIESAGGREKSIEIFPCFLLLRTDAFYKLFKGQKEVYIA